MPRTKKPVAPEKRPARKPAARRPRPPASPAPLAAAAPSTIPLPWKVPPRPVSLHLVETMIPLPISEISDRHREVLWEAFRLISERGYAGASLRELARRLGVSQPSLYHYVETKEQLVEQIITHLSVEILSGLPPPSPARLRDLPAEVCAWMIRIYSDPRYAPFVRFLFAVSTERPRFRDAVKLLYGGGFELLCLALMQRYVDAGEVSAADARHLLRLLMNTLGLFLMEEIVLYGYVEPTDELRATGEFVARFVTRAIDGRMLRRSK